MEGNNVRSFENLCKIFEMRIKLDREKKVKTPSDVLINYEKYAKKIDNIYNEEFEKEVRPLITPSKTIEEEKDRLEKLIKLLEDRLEKRNDLEDRYYLATGDYISGLQIVISDKELDEKRERLGLINRYLETTSEIESVHDSISKLKVLLSEEEEKKEERVFNACARVERPEPEETPAPESRKPEAVPSRQPSVAFDEFFEAFDEQHRGSRTEAEREWVALEANRALPGLPRILDALGQWEDSEAWKRQGGRYIPSAANFLKREYWLRKPPEPAEQGGTGEQPRPRAATVAQQRVQDNDDMAKMLLQARRAQHAQPGLHASTAGQSGAALPAGGQDARAAAGSGGGLGGGSCSVSA